MFLTIFDEIEKATSEILREIEGEAPEQRADRICDEVLEMLIDMYLLGWNEYPFGNEVDPDRMYDSVYEAIAGKTWEERIREYVLNDGTPADIARVIDTETHRVINQGIFDAADVAQDVNGLRINKTWVTMMDTRVRDTHDYLHGVTIPLKDRFYTYDDDSARYPGEFSKPENNVNCRCVLRLTW